MGRLGVRAVEGCRLPAGLVGRESEPKATTSGLAPAPGLASRRGAGAAVALVAGLFLLPSTIGIAARAAGPAEAQAPAGAAPPPVERFGFGRPAAPDEIAAWNIDVMPDGDGLPEGAGTAATGAPVYAAQCAVCHGAAGEGGVADRLVGYDAASTPPFGPRYEAWRAGRDDVPFSVATTGPTPPPSSTTFAARCRLTRPAPSPPTRSTASSPGSSPRTASSPAMRS